MDKLTPQTANTFSKVCKLKQDNIDYRGYWLLVEENKVTVVKQKSGKLVEFMVEIPKSVLDKFIKFYLGH
jgi:hypothetical protein